MPLVGDEMRLHKFEYDFVVSYASEDEVFAKELVSVLSQYTDKVFFAQTQEAQAEIWGKNLYEYLMEIYNKKGRFCIPLISKHYVEKIWTRHEWKSAQARALNEINRDYILPIRLDDTELPGLLSTIAYLDGRSQSVDGISAIAKLKLDRDIDRRSGLDIGFSESVHDELGGMPSVAEELLVSPVSADSGKLSFARDKKVAEIRHRLPHMYCGGSGIRKIKSSEIRIGRILIQRKYDNRFNASFSDSVVSGTPSISLFDLGWDYDGSDWSLVSDYPGVHKWSSYSDYLMSFSKQLVQANEAIGLNPEEIRVSELRLLRAKTNTVLIFLNWVMERVWFVAVGLLYFLVFSLISFVFYLIGSFVFEGLLVGVYVVIADLVFGLVILLEYLEIIDLADYLYYRIDDARDFLSDKFS